MKVAKSLSKRTVWNAIFVEHCTPNAADGGPIFSPNKNIYVSYIFQSVCSQNGQVALCPTFSSLTWIQTNSGWSRRFNSFKSRSVDGGFRYYFCKRCAAVWRLCSSFVHVCAVDICTEVSFNSITNNHTKHKNTKSDLKGKKRGTEHQNLLRDHKVPHFASLVIIEKVFMPADQFPTETLDTYIHNDITGSCLDDDISCDKSTI